MNATIGKSDYSLDWKLARYMGLYQILNPNGVKIYGYNPYHIVITGVILGSCVVMMLDSIALYNSMLDLSLYLYSITLIVLFCSLFFKLWIIMRNSDKIWDCFEVTKSNILLYKGYDKKIFQRWSRRSERFSYGLAILLIFASIGWALSPVIFNNTYIVTKNIDGSVNKYSLNIFNFNFMVTDTTYNRYFYVYFFIELVIYIFSVMIAIITYLIMVIMCHTISGHLETICNVIESLGHDQTFSDNIIGIIIIFLIRLLLITFFKFYYKLIIFLFFENDI